MDVLLTMRLERDLTLSAAGRRIAGCKYLGEAETMAPQACSGCKLRMQPSTDYANWSDVDDRMLR